ncbi:uncharacterized protein LOC125494696 [Beta vulgaris subsp. vulgaris]|uniref:uncharacterized protein LOC125494696 n=1 Tax=Beta vulgaris subsp. vulgaris TaxID=3555 RepID=UPI0020366D42|nr:uncharacterized protein LOC125494696 [Beta vulgaris subsp. vulgaris]
MESSKIMENDVMLKWKTFTTQSRISDKGMGLKYIAPVVLNGSPVAKLDKEEVTKLCEIWINSIIVYVIGQPPIITTMTTYIRSHWNMAVDPKIFKHEEGYFVVKLESGAERDAILFAGPYLFCEKPIIVKQWVPSFNFHNEVLRIIPLWAKLPNLPLHYWSSDSLSRIGSLLGIPVYADECTSKALRKLPTEVQIEEPNGATFKQKVTYDWLPPYCKKCLKVGHNCDTLVGKPKNIPKPVQKWVPKVQAVVEKRKVTEQKAPTGNPSVLVDPSDPIVNTGNPSIVVDLSNEITPVTTPNIHQPTTKENAEEGAWKVVTRKSKDKGKHATFQATKAVYFHQSGHNSGAPGGAKGPSPYLS